ncbi:DUF3105 domain-containing protein [Nocardia farcinica]|nr:DUF3105 domain-containing protein [Nocardia farcinica]MBF6420582.1 DUF3105 domain-containing protein [Nocardia farcinica]MBF6502344.1 DUF3105 domain-containing protein [Nocardia farcinica]MBF6520844.1 DUF3105 domain-containing protein [Nocardia farcinica]
MVWAGEHLRAGTAADRSVTNPTRFTTSREHTRAMPSSNSASKSAKAVRAAGKTSSRKRGGGKGQLPTKRPIPWLAIGAAAVIIALVGALAYSLVPKYREQAELERYTPSAEQQDPAEQIPGIVEVDYSGATGKHVSAAERVAYDRTPAFGGSHDQEWADCTGAVYDQPIRTENAVHSLEHGAVWIAYNPDKIDNAGLDTLKGKVEGKQYTMMSPYPGLDAAVSLQAWGHQLKVDSPDDKRINQFITALRQNPYTHPEVGGSCSNPPFGENPNPFDPTPPGPDAKPVDGSGIAADVSEFGGMVPGVPGIPGVPSAPVPGQPTQ